MSGLFSGGEKLTELARLPASSHGFQAPVHAGVGSDLYLVYYTEPAAPGWEASLAADPAGTLDRAPHAVAHFRHVIHFSAEAYDDDTIRDHRFADIGLTPFMQAEVVHSELVAQLMVRRAHSGIRQHRYPAQPRHFVFALHGHVYEIVAAGFELRQEHGPLLAALDRLMAVSA